MAGVEEGSALQLSLSAEAIQQVVGMLSEVFQSGEGSLDVGTPDTFLSALNILVGALDQTSMTDDDLAHRYMAALVEAYEESKRAGVFFPPPTPSLRVHY